MKRDLLFGDQLQLRVAAGELFQRDLRLEPAQRGADAEVDAAPEGQRAAGVGLESMSNRSGSGNTEASRPVAASQRNSLAPAGISASPMVTFSLVWRRHTTTDGS